MHYTIRHTTRFDYETAISESVMEARMQPRSEGGQRLVRFGLSTTPASRVRMYQDHDGNVVHHFSIPGRHARLAVTAEALVEFLPPSPLPATLGSWEQVDDMTATGAYWELLNPSPFARHTPLLGQFATEIDVYRAGHMTVEVLGPPIGLVQPPPHVEHPHGGTRVEQLAQFRHAHQMAHVSRVALLGRARTSITRDCAAPPSRTVDARRRS